MTTPAGPTGTDQAVVRYLARQLSWFVLHVFHHHGVGAAAEAIGFAGGVGRDEDDVFRCWETRSDGRWLEYREGSVDAPRRRCALREVAGWADRQLISAQWARVDELVAERNAAIVDAMPPDFWRSREARTPEELARIDSGSRRRYAAERELRQIVDEALAGQGRVGEQLDLFADL